MNADGRKSRPTPLHVWLVATLIAVALGLPAVARAAPATPTPAGELYAAVIPALRAQVTAAAGPLSVYRITASLDAAHHAIVADERVDYVNTTGAPVASLPFRLFPNASYYQPGGLLSALLVSGRQIAIPPLTVEQTVVTVPLGTPLLPAATASIELRFTTTIPVNSAGSFGILNEDTQTGTWVVSDWYPIVAGFEPGRGFRLDPPTSFGDPTFADEALYDVTLLAPTKLTVVASGHELAATPNAAERTVAHHYADGPARDFTFVADDNFASIHMQVGGTTVRVYTNPGAAAAQLALDNAASALAAYSARLGTYPFRDLNLVETSLDGAAGVSWTGLVFLDQSRLRFDPSDTAGADALRFTAAHEVAHQWWGMSVGANSNDHTFMVEGLTNYTAVLYIEWTAGESAAKADLNRYIAGPYLNLLASGPDQVADVPVANGQSASARSTIIYGKAALGFAAIRERIGNDAFLRALRGYAETYAYRIATPGDLLAVFEHASGQDLRALWQQWFEEATTTPQDVEGILPRAA